MKKCLVLAALAGVAFASVAQAGPDLQKRNPVVIDKSSIRHIGTPDGGFGARVVRAVYNNDVTADPNDGILFYDGDGIGQLVDDLSLATNGVTYPLLVTEMTIGFNTDGVNPSFGIAIGFYDGFDNAAPADSSWMTPFIDAFGVVLNDVPAGAYTVTVDLTGLPGGGLTLNDGGVQMEMIFADTQFTAAIWGGLSPLYWTSHNIVTSQDSQLAGMSDMLFGLDVDQDGIIEASEASYYYGLEYPTKALVVLSAETACPGGADFNGDGFVDFFDFDDFVLAFENGC